MLSVHLCKMQIVKLHTSAARLSMPIAYACSNSSRRPVRANAGSCDATGYPPALHSPGYGSFQAGLQQKSADSSVENELLWAGYSEHTEQLRRMHGQHEKMLVKIEELQAKIAQLQQQPPVSAWQVSCAELRVLRLAIALPAYLQQIIASSHIQLRSNVCTLVVIVDCNCGIAVPPLASLCAGSVILVVLSGLHQLCWTAGQLQFGNVHALGSCGHQKQHSPDGQAAAGCCAPSDKHLRSAGFLLTSHKSCHCLSQMVASSCAIFFALLV